MTEREIMCSAGQRNEGCRCGTGTRDNIIGLLPLRTALQGLSLEVKSVSFS